MPEFKVFTTIHAPYSKVWKYASVVDQIEKWSPVSFKNVASEEEVRNGLKLKQQKNQFGLFLKDLIVKDAYTESKVRRQYSFVDETDQFGFNRITYMFDDNSISTMIKLTEDDEAREVMEEQAKTEPEFQIDVMAHVFYTFGTNFWRQVVEWAFINPFFSLLYKGKVEKSLKKLKKLAEEE